MKNSSFEILANVVASQIKIHAKWGGVVPNLAKREHKRSLPIVLYKALGEAKLINPKHEIRNPKQILNTKYKILNTIDVIAVTIGPGLEPALWTGINFALDLSKVWDKPIIGINHMEAHIFSAFLKNKKCFGFRISDFGFPAVALLVSGGHTELVLVKNWLKYKIIGQTRDDAAGEAFDKVAKMLGLPYPGGPEISKIASKFKSEARSTKFEIKLPRPMINSKDYDFSFSGLKTAVLYLLRDLGAKKSGFRRIPRYDRSKENQFLGDALKIAICREFQQAVIDVLISKTIRAAKEFKVKTIILGGGVAANKELRRQMSKAIQNQIPNSKFLIPNTKYTTDNAAMIAVAAYFRALKKKSASWRTNWKTLKANGNLEL